MLPCCQLKQVCDWQQWPFCDGDCPPETSELQVHVNPLRSCEIHGKQRTKWGWQRCPREKATRVDLWELRSRKAQEKKVKERGRTQSSNM